MDVLLDVTVLFTLVLALSFVIERFLEVVKALYDLLDSQLNWHEFWTGQTERLKNRLEKRMRIFEYVDTKTAKSILHRFRGILLDKQGAYEDRVPVLSGDLVRAAVVKLGSRITGILLGIGLAFWMNIDLVSIWKDAAGTSARWTTNLSWEGVHIALSGIILGLGSGPVHKIVTTIERKREQRRRKGGQS